MKAKRKTSHNIKDSSAERLAKFKKANGTFFFQPYPWQQRALPVVHDKNTTAIISCNKIGKTALIINIVISWMIGYEPWQYVDKDEPGAVEVHGHWYRGSSLGVAPPVNIILTGEDWKLHIGRTLVPELKKWAPEGWYRTWKNEQGVEYIWEFCDKEGNWDNPSTLTLMSYSQDDALFESFRIQGFIGDEPPPQSKYKAMSRGLLLDHGKTLLSLTPIKEAWILDDIVLSGRKDIGIVKNLCITDNPDLLAADDKVLAPFLSYEQMERYYELLLYENFKKKQTVIDKGRGAEEYLESVIPLKDQACISNLRILKFIKDIDPADVPPRVFGKFKSLVGRVLKKFDRATHMIKPFDVPTDWPVTAMVDFHLNVPQAISYWAINKQDIVYCVNETWEHLSADGIADDIIRKWKGGYNIKKVYIDPLSKGDTAYMRNQLGTDIKDTYSILDEKLSKYKITLQVASKDKESGIQNIESMLAGPNGLPTCFLFDTCTQHLFEVMRWVYDDQGKPAKKNDHFMENWYRYTLTGARWKDTHFKSGQRNVPVPSQSGWMGR
jgi:hypothetical protein